MADAPASASRRERPLSPFITVYRWPVTMLTSIVHRVTGVGLGIGVLVLAWWLIATATGVEAYNLFQTVAHHWLGKLVLFGFTWALMFHAVNGVRHLVWDIGYAFEKHTAERMSTLILVLSVLLTVLVWLLAYWSMGAF